MIFKFVQGQKHHWSASFKFIDPRDKSVFLLYKIICKDNNTNVQSFNDQ